MELVLSEPALVNAPVFELEAALAVVLIVLPETDIALFVRPLLEAEAVRFLLLELADVNLPALFEALETVL